MTYYQTYNNGEIRPEEVIPMEAMEDPRTPGFFFLPYGAVTTPPPHIPDGHIAIWDEKVWTVREDNRGKQGWVDKEFVTIQELGPLPENFSDTPPEIEEEEVIAVTKRQLLLELLNYGITEQLITTFIGDNEEAQIEWTHATIIESTHYLIESLRQALNLTKEQVVTIFRDASKR